jgi:hypothetical protein
MRNLSIILLFSAISIFSFAQTPFTTEVFQALNKRALADFSKVMAEETSPDFTFTNGNGVVLTYDQMKDMTNKITEWNISDVKIKQIGKMAVATGINKHNILFTKTNTTAFYNMRFTYTYEFINKKWMWLTAQHSDIAPRQTPEEEAAIKRVLDDETIAYLTGDKDKMLSFWAKNDKTFHIGSNADGSFWNFDNATIDKVVASLKPTTNTAVKSNHRISIKGNMAIVDFDQITTLPNGSTVPQHSAYMLEKVGSDWKIISASAHGLPNNAENPEDIAKQWVSEYNKDGKSFFENNCSEDFIASNFGIDGGKFFGKEFIVNRARKENETNDAEPTNMKTFKSGNLAVVVGNLTWHHKQADGSDKPDKTISTFIMQKKNGKWWYAGHLISPLKE